MKLTSRFRRIKHHKAAGSPHQGPNQSRSVHKAAIFPCNSGPLTPSSEIMNPTHKVESGQSRYLGLRCSMERQFGFSAMGSVATRRAKTMATFMKGQSGRPSTRNQLAERKRNYNSPSTGVRAFYEVTRAGIFRGVIHPPWFGGICGD
jgi:hypothetical protein